MWGPTILYLCPSSPADFHISIMYQSLICSALHGTHSALYCLQEVSVQGSASRPYKSRGQSAA